MKPWTHWYEVPGGHLASASVAATAKTANASNPLTIKPYLRIPASLSEPPELGAKPAYA